MRLQLSTVLVLCAATGCAKKVPTGNFAAGEDGGDVAASSGGEESTGENPAPPDSDPSATSGMGSEDGDPPAPDTCGDGVIQAPETCDGDDFAGADCVGFGFDGGSLSGQERPEHLTPLRQRRSSGDVERLPGPHADHPDGLPRARDLALSHRLAASCPGGRGGDGKGRPRHRDESPAPHHPHPSTLRAASTARKCCLRVDCARWRRGDGYSCEGRDG